MSARLTTAIRIGEAARAILLKTRSFPSLEESDLSEHRHVGVEPMLLALSMELALKAWFVFDFDNPNPERSHDLLKLFEKLKPESQARLDARFKRSVVPYHPNWFYIDYGIRDLLNQHRNAFLDWRYLHEGQRSMMFDQGEFEATLDMVLQEFETRYRVEPASPF